MVFQKTRDFQCIPFVPWLKGRDGREVLQLVIGKRPPALRAGTFTGITLEECENVQQPTAYSHWVLVLDTSTIPQFPKLSARRYGVENADTPTQQKISKNYIFRLLFTPEFAILYDVLRNSLNCPHRLSARTLGFHPSKRSSTLLGGATFRRGRFTQENDLPRFSFADPSHGATAAGRTRQARPYRFYCVGHR